MGATLTPLSPLYNDPVVEGSIPTVDINRYNAMNRVNRACPQYDICYPRRTRRKCLIAMGHDQQLPRLLYYKLTRKGRVPAGLGELGVVTDIPSAGETIVERELFNPTPDAAVAMRTARRLADAFGRRTYIVGSFGSQARPSRLFMPVVYVQPGGLVRLIDHTPVGTTSVTKLTPFEFEYLVAMSNGINLLPAEA